MPTPATRTRAHVHRTISAFFHDLLHGAFHFEGRIWRTLPALVIRPGKLTREYIAGARARYIPPMALFLFATFLMFAVLVLTGGHGTGLFQVDPHKVAEAERDLATRKASRAAAAAAGLPTEALDRGIAEHEYKLSIIRQPGEDTAVATITRQLSTQVSGPLAGKLHEVAEEPALFLYKLKMSAYIFSWVLIPLSLPFLWLMFPFSRRYNLYDHVVFITYSLSFVTLLLSLELLLGAVGAAINGAIVISLIVAHFAFQLHDAYRLGRIGTMVRAVLLGYFAIFALAQFTAGLLVLGLLE